MHANQAGQAVRVNPDVALGIGWGNWQEFMQEYTVTTTGYAILVRVRFGSETGCHSKSPARYTIRLQA